MSITPNREAVLRALEAMKIEMSATPPANDYDALWRNFQIDFTSTLLLYNADCLDRGGSTPDTIARVITALSPGLAAFALSVSEGDFEYAFRAADVMTERVRIQMRGWLSKPEAFGAVVTQPVDDSAVGRA